MESGAPGIDWRHAFSTALGVLAGTVAAAGTAAVAVAGFTLSYDAIRRVGIASYIREDWAWLLPVSVDGAMAVATVTAVVMQRMGRSVWYPWLVVVAGAGISVGCNALHAYMQGGAIKLDARVAMAVSAIPALMLALSVHLLVVLIDAAARTVGQPTEATRPPLRAVVADLDDETAAWLTSIRQQARQVRAAVMGGLAEPRRFPPPPPVAVVADRLSVTAPASEPPAEPPDKQPSATTPVADEPLTETAKRVARWHTKMPDATNAVLAKKAGVSRRSVERYRPARNTD